MGFWSEARDPWAMVVAGVVGGLAWAVGVPALAAAGVGAAVLGVKAVAGAAINREPPGARTTTIRAGTTEHRWLVRAQRAVGQFAQLGGTAPQGPIAEKVRGMGEEARRTLEAVQRLASQATALSVAEQRVDSTALAEEERRLLRSLERASVGPQRVEVERSLASVRAQLDVDRRLQEASRTVTARLEATVLGLEGLVARLVEVLALVEAQSPVEASGQIDALGAELEGLRSGLVETEHLSRRLLSAYGSAGNVGDAQGPGDAVRRRRARERGGGDVQAP